MTKKNTTTKVLGFLILALLASVTSFAQQSFLGLKAGISTKPEVERVLGRAVKQISKTLTEYPPKQVKANGNTVKTVKTYVQYRDDIAASVAERIEILVCVQTSAEDPCDILDFHYEFDPALARFPDGYVGFDGTLDAEKVLDEGGGYRHVRYMGAPRYMIRTDVNRYEPKRYAEGRWAFYSKQLYETVAPTEKCLKTAWGEWETEFGRMTITRTDAGKFRATYSKNNGTVNGIINSGLDGEWKDSTGSGTISLSLLDLTDGPVLRGRWTRATGDGPKEGTWEGRCVESVVK